MIAPGLLRAVRLSSISSSRCVGLLPAQAAQVVQRLPLHVEQLGRALRCGGWRPRSARSACAACLRRSAPACADRRSAVRCASCRLSSSRSRSRNSSRILPSSSSRLGLLLQRPLFDLQFRFAAPIRCLAIRTLQNRAGFRLRIFPAQAVQQLDDREGQRGGDHGTDDDRDRHLVHGRHDETYHVPLPNRDQRGTRSAVVAKASTASVRSATVRAKPMAMPTFTPRARSFYSRDRTRQPDDDEVSPVRRLYPASHPLQATSRAMTPAETHRRSVDASPIRQRRTYRVRMLT